MDKYIEKNKIAWEYRAYEFTVKNSGKPESFAKSILEDPAKKLKKHIKYFENINGLKIANICGSSGKRAVALGALGGQVTVFDFSNENKRYAVELAKAADVKLSYVVTDILKVDLNMYGNTFDMLYLEGGILHNFHNLKELMDILYALLKKEGKIVLNDFHPFRKVMPINFFKSTVNNYFDQEIHSGDLAYKDFLDNNEDCPECYYRYYTISEIINTSIQSGFTLLEFQEEPSWTDSKLPGEITLYAKK